MKDAIKEEKILSTQKIEEENKIVFEGTILINSKNISKNEFITKDEQESLLKRFTINNTSGDQYKVIDSISK
ncbi:hypothetical protein SFC52_03865 [Niallia circulans]|uniref:hypothetical protein n=1 Tax=Niallia circulans TaxID=1397 RepID=UPI003982600C